MDMHSSHLHLPGEAPTEEAASAAPVASPQEAAGTPSLWRALPAYLSQRKGLCATTALVLCGMAGILTIHALQPGAEDFGLPVDAPAVASAVPASPALDRNGTIPVVPQPVASLSEAPVPAMAPPATPLAPTPALVSPMRQAEADPLAEQRQLLQQATAPIATTVTQPAPNEEVGKLSAMVTSVSAMLGESLKSQIVLRREVAQLQADLRAAQADANSRIAFIEARVNVAATQSVAAGSNAVPPTSQRPPPTPAPRSTNAATTYRITGAANNLAYLVAFNPAPGQPPAVEAKPGSDVPGYGKVLSIAQRGTAWEIVTERGSITN